MVSRIHHTHHLKGVTMGFPKPTYNNLKQIADEIEKMKKKVVVRATFEENDVVLGGFFNPVANTLDVGGMILPFDIAEKWLASNYGFTEISIEVLP